jgi:hypothetical protein
MTRQLVIHGESPRAVVYPVAMNQSRCTAAKRVTGTSSFHPAAVQIDQLTPAARANSSRFNVTAVTCNLETLFEQMYRRDRTGPLLEDLMVEHSAPAPHAELCA